MERNIVTIRFLITILDLQLKQIIRIQEDHSISTYFYHRKTSVLKPSFHKVVGLDTCNSIKNRLQLRRFLVKFGKFLTTSIITDHILWLLLNGIKSLQIIHFSQFFFFLNLQSHFSLPYFFNMTSSIERKSISMYST